MTSTLTPPDGSTEADRLPVDLPTDLPANAGRAATGIAIVLVAQLMFVLDATVVNVALPQIDTALGFGPASLSWVRSIRSSGTRGSRCTARILPAIPYPRSWRARRTMSSATVNSVKR